MPGVQMRPQIGIGSFAYRYAIGSSDFRPDRPMTVFGFLSEAHRLGFDGVQLCENLAYSKLDKEQLIAVKEKAQELGLFVEVGMRDVTVENLLRHLQIAELLSSQFLRVVLGSVRLTPEEEPARMIKDATRNLKEVLPICRKLGLTVGIENHFDLRTEDLIGIVEGIGDERVGMILDTTNCLGFMERPEETLQALKPYLRSIHLKDYSIRKVEAGYLISGTPLGDGWLNTAEILREAMAANPELTIILELNVRRKEGQSVAEILRSEEQMIIRSLGYLNTVLAGIS